MVGRFSQTFFTLDNFPCDDAYEEWRLGEKQTQKRLGNN
jgi:hypothetical protein